MLGVAPSENSSGKKNQKKIKSGSDLCRKAFWQWIFTRIEPAKSRKNNPLLEELYQWMRHPKRRGTPIQLLRMKVAAKAARMIFDRLVEELC